MANYDETSIKILEGLEAVRKRPGMYIGSTDKRGLHHLIWEIVDNSIDEIINGFGDTIKITLNKEIVNGYHVCEAVILTNKENVIYSNLVSLGAKLDNHVKLLIKNATTIKGQNLSYEFGEKKISGIYNMLPIVTNEGIEGSLIVFGDDIDKTYDICVLINRIIQLELNIT